MTQAWKSCCHTTACKLLDNHVLKVGRVGVIHDNRPDVLPVNYAVVDGPVVVRNLRASD